MATMTPPAAEQSGTPDLDSFAHHWQDEADAADLYRLLADCEPDPESFACTEQRRNFGR